MARWYALDVAGDAFGPVFEEKDKRSALDRATAVHGQKCWGVMSLLEWEEVVRQRQIAARRKVKDGNPNSEEEQ